MNDKNIKDNSKTKKTILKYLFSVIGICFSSLGVALLLVSQLGSGPFDAFNYYMSIIYQSNDFFSFLNVANTVIFHSALINLLIVAVRKKPKYLIYLIPGTLFGFVLGLWMDLINLIPYSEPIRYVYAPLGVFMLALGICVGVICNVMMTPYDGFGFLVHDYIIKDMGKARMILEGLFFVLSLVLALLFWDFSQIGIFTVIVVFLLGPLVKFLIKHINKLKIFKYLNS